MGLMDFRKVPDAGLPARLQDAELNATYDPIGAGAAAAAPKANAVDVIPKWKATTAYAQGDLVVDPFGDLVSARVAFTSGASFDAANWNASSIPKWRANTNYPAGSQVVSPSGDIVTTVAGGTSGATYAESAWTLSPTYAPAGSLPSIPALGVTPANLKTFRKKLAQVRIASGSMRVLCVGDSTTLGFGTSNGPNVSAWPGRIKPLLNSYVAPTIDGLSIPPNAAADTRWTAGTGWTIDGSYGWGGKSSYKAASTATGNLTYTPGTNVDTFDIYTFTSDNNGTIPTSIDGGTVTNIVTGGVPPGWKKTTITVAAGSGHVLTFAPPTANVFVTGVDAYLSTASNIRIGNAGSSGSTTAGWVLGGGFSSITGITTYAPDLTIIMLGINDASGSVTSATHTVNIEALIDAAKISGDVIVMSVVPSGDGRSTLEAQYRDANKASAKAKGCAYINIFDRFADYTTANGLGFMSDVSHPSYTGYAEIAGAVFSTIKSL